MPEHKKGFNHIAADVVFNGTITFNEELVISGLLLGKIEGEEGDLRVTEKGEVQGECNLNSVHIYGKVSGKTSANSAHLHSGSISHSDFLVSEIIVDKTAIINGNITMLEKSSSPE